MTDGSDVVGPLDDNGGPTMTHALLEVAGNPAIDAGNQAACDDLDNDQRGEGFPRTVDGDLDDTATCDVGAVELQVLDPNDLIFRSGFE